MGSVLWQNEMVPDPSIDGSASLSPFSPTQAPLPQRLQSTPSRWTSLSHWPWTRWEPAPCWGAAPRSAPCPRWAWSQYLCLPWPPCPWAWPRCQPWAPSGWARGWALQDQCPKLCTVQECRLQPPRLQIQLTLSSYKDPIKGTFLFLVFPGWSLSSETNVACVDWTVCERLGSRFAVYSNDLWRVVSTYQLI